MRRRRSPICPLTLSAILSRRTIVLAGKPMAVSFPAANARHEHEWKIWREVKLAAGKVVVPGGIDSRRAQGGASGSRRRPHPELRQCGRARERHRRRRLRLRHLCRPRSGRQQDRLAQTAIARRRRPPRLRAAMGEAGIVTNTTDVSLQSVGNLWAPTASDIEGPTDLDWVSLCFETEISRCALDSCMAQKRSNCLQIASAFQNVESLRPA